MRHIHFLVISLIVTISMSSKSKAGYYTATFSGGSAKITNLPRISNYAHFGDYGGTWTQDGSPCKISCSGAITATFTYNQSYPDEPTPPAILLYQEMDCTWSGSGEFTTGLTPQISFPKGAHAKKIHCNSESST